VSPEPILEVDVSHDSADVWLVRSASTDTVHLLQTDGPFWIRIPGGRSRYQATPSWQFLSHLAAVPERYDDEGHAIVRTDDELEWTLRVDYRHRWTIRDAWHLSRTVSAIERPTAAEVNSLLDKHNIPGRRLR
jgi:hypothetical protein